MPCQSFVASSDAHETDDGAISASHWHLSSKKPVQIALFIIPDFQAVRERLAGAKDLLVIVAKSSRDVRLEKCLVGAPDHVALTIQAQAFNEISAARDHPTPAIFHKKEHVWQMLEHGAKTLRIGHLLEEGVLEAAF